MSEDKNTWGSPTIILAILGLVVSISANIYQYTSSKQKFELAQEMWKLEERDLKNKLEEYEDKKRKRETHLQEIEQKIAKLTSDIEYCEEEIVRGQVGLDVYMRIRLDPSLSKSEKLDAEGKMTYAQDLIDKNRYKREKLKTERDKLEIQRSNNLMYQ